MAFLGYATIAAPRRIYRLLKELDMRHSLNGAVADVGFQQDIVHTLGTKFHGFMLSLHSLGQGINTQRFFTTFAGRYHGLS